ncbi:MAG TPA: DUF1761 domain-containing protein [Thermoanaerobaculia bacterium]|nr:DUF1761 domain-containing protein [Thermoanaerobaculia bacterium]
MALPPVKYPAVFVTGVIIFLLGGLWYSPVVFARRWMTLMARSEEELKAGAGSMPVNFTLAFLCGLLIAWVMAIILGYVGSPSAATGAIVGSLCWLGFAASTSYATAVFSNTPKELWLINSGYNLVCFVIAGVILSVWR